VHPDPAPAASSRAGGHTSRVRVRYAETDQMGVAYHTHYLVWCEVGRTGLLRSLGSRYADLERDGLRLAVAAASIRYLRSARYDDVVEVVTRVALAQSRMVTFAYDIVGVDPARGLLARAETRLIALDASGSPRRIPGELQWVLADQATGTP
jgi:acyl-CoA thioester hydrolase